jgi:dienelactone hydrolase
MDPEPTALEQPQPKPTFRQRIVKLWRTVAVWFARFWTDVRPGPEARGGAAWGSLAAALVAAVIAGRYMKTGFGWWIDFLFCFAVAALVILISAALVPLLLTILRKLPRLVSGMILGSVFVIGLAFMPLGLGVGPIACLPAAILGASLATLFSAGFRQAAARKKALTLGLFVLSLAAVIGEIVFLASAGSMEGLVKAQLKSPLPDALRAPNPGESGTFKTRVVYYGTKGGNPRRPEYNNPTVATPTVDASRFFKDFKGWQRNLRKTYWGYDMDKLPLNATVWVPEGPGPFPLVLMVHGNHNMAEFSEPGYQYLGELLASRGFIFASVDENFLNGGLFHSPPKEPAVRGWMLLEHLKLWRDWSRDQKNPLGVAINFNQIALMGHSRGGEAAATAALFNQLEHYPDDATIRFDYHFPIRSVVAIAPADGQYKPAGQWRSIENVNYFTIQGANDADVSSFVGSCQWDRVRYTDGGEWFKSELYIYRANHGQFNTVWGRSDAGYPLGWFLNLKPLLNPEDQRRIAKVYLSAFLEATLHGRREYVPLFRDCRSIRTWLPDTLYISRYQDAAYKLVADFNEDPDVSTTTLPGGRIGGGDLSVWREGRIPFREGDRAYNGVFLGWNRNDAKGKEDTKIKPVYSIQLPEHTASTWKLTSASALVFSLAALDEDAPLLNEKDGKKGERKKEDKPESKKEREAPEFTVELETADGIIASRPLSDFGTILPPLKVRFTKLEWLDNLFFEKSSEPVFQTIAMPLSAFAQQKGFDAGRLKMIRLRFDRTAASVILLSRVGFE